MRILIQSFKYILFTFKRNWKNWKGRLGKKPQISGRRFKFRHIKNNLIYLLNFVIIFVGRLKLLSRNQKKNENVKVWTGVNTCILYTNAPERMIFKKERIKSAIPIYNIRYILKATFPLIYYIGCKFVNIWRFKRSQ